MAPAAVSLRRRAGSRDQDALMTTTNRNKGWIRKFHQSPGAEFRLVLFPHAGGSANVYFPLSAELSPAVEVLAVQYPGRQDRSSEPLMTDLNTMADGLSSALRPWAGRRLALFGHSMGATVAFEVARRLPVDALFVSGRRAPGRTVDEGLHRRRDDELVAAIRAMHGPSSALFEEPELIEILLPALRGDFEASETYIHRPGPPIDCPIIGLVGTKDPRVPTEEMSYWAGFTTSAFHLHTFVGGHFYLEAQRPAVAEIVREHLGRATALRP
jgi:pyochelin biosynthetic protein PchC